MKLLSFDIESTGVDPLEDRIVELSVFRFEPVSPRESNDYTHFKVINSFEARYNPGRSIPTGATEKHGITDEDVADKPPFSEDAAMVQEMFRDGVLVGYNSRRFDTLMLDAELRRSGQEGFPRDNLGRLNPPEIDAWQVWKALEPRTLEGALWRWRKKRLEDAHQASADARATIEVLEGIVASQEVSLDSLQELSNPESEVDRAGKLTLDEDGEVCLNFGKHRGTPVKDVDVGYFKWMSGADFPQETMNILRYLYQHNFTLPEGEN